MRNRLIASQRKVITIFAIFIIIFLLCVFSCDQFHDNAVNKVSFNEVITNPGKYNSKIIDIEGYYFSSFEVIVLCERLGESGYADGHLVPGGELIWIEGGIPVEVRDSLFKQSIMGPTEYFGKIMIEGKFQFGKNYGHLGGYKYQIVPVEVKLVNWMPDI